MIDCKIYDGVKYAFKELAMKKFTLSLSKCESGLILILKTELCHWKDIIHLGIRDCA